MEKSNQTADSPTLTTMNEIGRHVSTMVYTKVVNKSPWLRKSST